jgi:hypothetical protein
VFWGLSVVHILAPLKDISEVQKDKEMENLKEKLRLMKYKMRRSKYNLIMRKKMGSQTKQRKISRVF